MRRLGGVPFVQPWMLILSAVLAAIGLAILFPKRSKHILIFSGDTDGTKDRRGMRAQEGGKDNNPVVTVHFGGISRYLHADCLETAQLDCSFGGLEVFFDQVQLSPNGARVNCNCNFGGVEIFVPRGWRVIDKMSCMLGSVNIDGRFVPPPADDAPELTLTGNVSFGGVEVKYI